MLTEPFKIFSNRSKVSIYCRYCLFFICLEIISKVNNITTGDSLDIPRFCISSSKPFSKFSNIKNKSIVKVAKRTYANSVVRRNSALTESASIDITLACIIDLSARQVERMILGLHVSTGICPSSPFQLRSRPSCGGSLR